MLRVAALSGAVAMLVLAMGCWLAMPLLLPILAGGFPLDKLAEARSVALPLSLLPALAAAVAVASAALTVHGRAAAAAAVLLITPLSEICLLFLPVQLEIAWFGWLRLAGGAAELLLVAGLLGLLLPRSALGPHELRRTFDRLLPAGRQFAALTLAAGLGTVSVLVDQAMAAPLGGGAVSTLGYGSKITLGLMGVFDAALAATVFPELARLAAIDDLANMRRTVLAWTLRTFVGALIAAGLVFAFSEPLVRLLFERGSFDPGATRQVALVQAWYVLQLPFHAAALLGTRLLTALSRNQALVLVSVLNVLVNWFGNLVFRAWFGLAGIALATSFVYAVAALATFALARQALAGRRLART
jgi:putative peptidoglycan lipid II flippase